MKKIIAIVTIFLFATVPQIVLAQTAGTGGGIKEGLGNIQDQFPSQSELAQSQTVGDVVVAVIRILLGLLLAIAVLFIIIGGYQYITSAGKEDQAKQGRRTLTYAIIGLIIVVLAYVIVNVVAGSVDSTAL